MRVRLLGPVEVTLDGAPRPVHGLRRTAVLAVLALQPGEVVSTDRLIDVVWAAGAPPTAANTLQRHVSHLRRLLGGKATVLARPPGYLLNLGAAPTDVEVAKALIERGIRAAEPAQRVRQIRAALDLWRGRALLDVTGLPWLAEQARHLDHLRLRATLVLTEARLALGEHDRLVPDLERLAIEHPLDERVREQLMLALYRTGRQADALAAYRRLRRMLADELGIDPCQTLRDLEAAILRQDVALDVPVHSARHRYRRCNRCGRPPRGRRERAARRL